MQLHDWVHVTDPGMHYDGDVQVQELRALCYSDRPMGYLSRYGIVFPLEEEVSPVPLTVNMLIKNGFREVEEYVGLTAPLVTYIHSSRTHCIVILKRRTHLELRRIHCDGGGLSGGLKLEYVHQLQQVMRLCGFHDMAKNFKIDL